MAYADKDKERYSDYGEQDVFNREQNYSGTIRENLEKYRSDNVTAAKARQSSASRKKKNKEVVKRRKAAVKAARKGKTVRVVVRISLAILVIALCVIAFLLTYKLFYDVALDENNKTKVEITIPEEGITHEEVAQFLYENGCISDPRLYKYRTYIYDANYIPGTYKVSPSYTTEKIINILSGYDYSDGTMDED